MRGWTFRPALWSTARRHVRVSCCPLHHAAHLSLSASLFVAAGEGLVTEADIPSLKRHPQVQKSPEASAHLRFVFVFRFLVSFRLLMRMVTTRQSFMIDSTSFVQRTVEFLIAPSPYRLPVSSTKTTPFLPLSHASRTLTG